MSRADRKSAAVTYRDAEQHVVVGLLVLDRSAVGGHEGLGPVLRLYRGVVVAKVGRVIKPRRCVPIPAQPTVLALQTQDGQTVRLRFESDGAAEEWRGHIDAWADETNPQSSTPQSRRQSSGGPQRRHTLRSIAQGTVVAQRVGGWEKRRIHALEKEVSRLNILLGDRDREIVSLKQRARGTGTPPARGSGGSTPRDPGGAQHARWVAREQQREIGKLRSTVEKMTRLQRVVRRSSSSSTPRERVLTPSGATKGVGEAMAACAEEEATLESLLLEEQEIERDAAALGDELNAQMWGGGAHGSESGLPVPMQHHAIEHRPSYDASVTEMGDVELLGLTLKEMPGRKSGGGIAAMSNAALMAKLRTVKARHGALKKAGKTQAMRRAARQYKTLSAERNRRKKARAGGR